MEACLNSDGIRWYISGIHVEVWFGRKARFSLQIRHDRKCFPDCKTSHAWHSDLVFPEQSVARLVVLIVFLLALFLLLALLVPLSLLIAEARSFFFSPIPHPPPILTGSRSHLRQ